jgi:hypothetical protein
MTNRLDASKHESGWNAIATLALPAFKETITNKIAAICRTNIGTHLKIPCYIV